MEGEPHFTDAIDEVWYQYFGHGYKHCLQLAEIPGEIGHVHKQHLEYVRRIVQLPHENADTGSSQA